MNYNEQRPSLALLVLDSGVAAFPPWSIGVKLLSFSKYWWSIHCLLITSQQLQLSLHVALKGHAKYARLAGPIFPKLQCSLRPSPGPFKELWQSDADKVASGKIWEDLICMEVSGRPCPDHRLGVEAWAPKVCDDEAKHVIIASSECSYILLPAYLLSDNLPVYSNLAGLADTNLQALVLQI